MITKEQALTGKNFKQIRIYGPDSNFRMVKHFLNSTSLTKPIKWRANGKCQTWKTKPEEFKLPIKHGLYNYSYITHENAHLFELDE